MKKDLDKLQNIIEYRFNDEKLLITSLTHSSYAAEHGKSHIFNNERLEFIGDAYLDAIIGIKLYSIMLDSAEGTLSKIRADIVCEESLAHIARQINLGEYLFLGKGEIKTNGANKPSILSDALEALIGAIILDGGYEEGKRVVVDLFSEQIRMGVLGKLKKDYKSALQEKFQNEYHSNELSYELIEEDGPPHDRLFTVEVRHRGIALGKGTGKSKAKAEQAAAADVLAKGDL